MNWRKHAYLLSHDLIGSRLHAFYQELLGIEKWSTERLETLHRERLDALLRHAVKRVPFYRERVKTPDLSAFPILRKEEVKTHFTELMEPSLLKEYSAKGRELGYSWTEVRTGGSTGMPTVMIHDRAFRDWGRATRLYSQHLCGFPIGTPFFMLWGSMRDINDSQESIPKRALFSLLQAHLLNAFLMDADRMERYAQQIEKSSIRHLMAYVDAAEALAAFIEKRGPLAHRLESIMACAGMLTDTGRATLQRVFGARVHNKYGSRECADMACECAAGGFHIFRSGVHLEIVDAQGQPLPVGETGRILVTLLHNQRFPVIRYEIGDIGALSEECCPCGSPMPLLKTVEGRISEFVTTVKGDAVSPVFLRHLIGVVHDPRAIERYRFIQTGSCEYELQLQMDTEISDSAFEETARAIEADLAKVLGAEARVAISRRENIPTPDNGKNVFITNETVLRDD